MIIKRIHIYGFGRWSDYQLTLPENKVVVIYGENEAGKSTLRSFLLFLLFGLPPKKREFYRPKSGGGIGGRIEVWTETNGSFTIERLHEKNNGEAVCYLADGKERGEEWLKEQLQKMDEKMYHSIFSFSANDLNYLHKVTGEEIGEVLLGMGMAGTSAIYQAERTLEQKLEERFKPQGKNPPINQQINRLEKLEKQLHELEKEENQYHLKKEKEMVFLTALKEKQLQVEREEQQKRELEQKIQALPFMIEYFSIQEELPEKQEVAPFPEEGIDRYGKLKEAILPLESERTVLLNNKQDDAERLETVKEKTINKEQFRELKQWEKEKDDQSRQQDYLSYQSEELKSLQIKIENELDTSSTGITFDELQDINLPFYTEDKWDDWRQEKQQLEKEVMALSEKEKEKNQELSHLQSVKEKMENNLVQEEPDLLTVSRYKSEESQRADHKKRTHQEKSNWYSNLLAGTGLLISIILFIISLTAGPGWLAVLGGLFLALATGFGVWKMRYGKGTIPAVTHRTGSYSDADVPLNNIKEQIQKSNIELLKLTEKKKFFEKQSDRLQANIQEEREIYPFLSTISVEQWPKLFGVLNQILYKYKQFASLEQSVRQLKEENTAFQTKTVELYERIFSTECDESHPIEKMIEKAAEQTELQVERQRIEEKIIQTDAAIRVCNQKLAPYQSEMLNLLKAAQVESEEEFYTKGKKKEQNEMQRKRMNDLLLQLRPLLTDKELKTMLTQKHPTQGELELKLEEVKEISKKLKTEVEDCRQKLSDIRSSLAVMETSEQLSELRHLFELEKENLMKQAKDWARYKLAKEALDETKKLYREKYFPTVMETASEIFSMITNGRYQNVWLTEENTLLIEQKNGQRFAVQELSKGTNDQLYLALKIALSELTNKQQPLPFLIDDAFVHFDSKRLETIPELLKKTTSSNQVIWFTCNPSNNFEKEGYGLVYLHQKQDNSISLS